MESKIPAHDFRGAGLVVDTHSKPSASRALIEHIKKLTPKPVKFVVNTALSLGPLPGQ